MLKWKESHFDGSVVDAPGRSKWRDLATGEHLLDVVMQGTASKSIRNRRIEKVLTPGVPCRSEVSIIGASPARIFVAIVSAAAGAGVEAA